MSESPQRVLLYTRDGCHLCEDARALLAYFEQRGDLTVDAVNITRDPVLFDRYHYRVPVIAVGDLEIDPPITLAALRAALNGS